MICLYSDLPVPNYLRTKLDLDLEAKQKELLKEAKEKDVSLKGEITVFNNIITSCQKIVADAKEDMEDQKSRTGVSSFTSFCLAAVFRFLLLVIGLGSEFLITCVTCDRPHTHTHTHTHLQVECKLQLQLKLVN